MDDTIADIDHTMMMAAGLSILQRLNIIMAGAAAADGSNKLDPFVVTWCHGPLTTLLNGENISADRSRTSRARPDYIVR